MQKLLFILLLLGLSSTGFSQKIIIEHSDETPKPSMLEAGKFKVFLHNDTNSPIHLFFSHHKQYGGNEITSEKSVDGKIIYSISMWKPMDTNSKYSAKAVKTIAPGAKKHLTTFLIDEKLPGTYTMKYRINQDPATINKNYAQNGAAVLAVSRITEMDIKGSLDYTIEQLEKKPFEAREITYEELKKLKGKNTDERAIYDPSSVFMKSCQLESAADAAKQFEELAKLKNVRKLFLKVNSNEDIVVPAIIGELPLMELSISSNSKNTGKLIFPTGFLELGDLRTVSVYDIKGLNLSFLSKHSKLERLSINRSELVSFDWLGLGDLAKLTDLTITSTNLKDLPSGFEKLTGLKNLTLTKGKLSSIENLPISTELKILNISENELTSLPVSLNELTGLTNLVAYSNKIVSLPDDMSGLANLSKVNLGVNQLTKFPEGLMSLKALKELGLSGNKIKSIPASIGKLTLLGKLNLSENGMTAFPKELKNCPKLSDLNIKKNSISVLPVEVTKLRVLRRFNFEDNKITGFPEGFLEMKFYWIYSKNNPLDNKALKKMKKAFGKKVKS